jgi:uncharacterized protein YbjQ (UPF0145 family)
VSESGQTTATEVEAGWYPDPNDPGLRRYFDGTQWTEHTAPGGDPRTLIIAVTTDEVPGREIGEALGIVYGVMSGATGGAAGFTAISDYVGPNREKTHRTRNSFENRFEAELRMRGEAQKLGADAVVGVRCDTSPFGTAGLGFEIVVYGTAVSLKPLGN